MSAEKRKHPRFHVKYGALAALRKPGELMTKIGLVEDISEGGLGFAHVGKWEWPDGRMELEIAGHEMAAASMGRISCKLVHKDVVDIDAFDPLETVHCGLQFEELSENQSAALKQIIKMNKAKHAPLTH